PAPKPPEPVADEHIVGAPTPVPVPPLRPPPVDVMRTADIVLDASSPRVGPDLVTTREIVGEGSAPFMVARPPAPPAEAPRRSPATAVLAAGIAVAGLAIGYGLSRRGQVPAPSPVPAVASVPTPAEPPAPAARAPAPRVQPRREREPAGPPSIEVTADPAGDVYVDGKRAGRTPLTRAVSRGRHKVRLVDRASGVDVTKVVEVKAARAPVRFALGKGTLTVTAPEGAVIFLDGRKVGAGGVQDLPVYEGTHNLTVQLGQARNDHAFRIGPAETYRYDVERTGP
ncbi:MAG TPA: PEGA domain-containing protein, partial [Anaeromyxobacteraceae bacterium]|nr:PEGA domain-containing protein [Anaeromyxobacteraceae bacterium]